jgi:prepilin-type N-terminal cleavage/methylation domain-containing protein
MKTIKRDLWRVTSDEMTNASRITHHAPPVTRHPSLATPPRHVSRFTFHASRFTFHVSGFTLIELLVVIAIMAALAALLLPVVGAVKKHQYIFSAQAEMAKLETAIDRYKATYGFYPPDNRQSTTNAMINQLYYELVGTTNADLNNPSYQPLDGRGLTLPASDVQNGFGVGGIMNCSKPGGGEDITVAKNFLPDLKPNQIGVVSNYSVTPVGVTVLLCAVGGPDNTYQPMNALGVNPWRYISSNPINNPGSYDLWIQLSIAGKTNLICNWSKQVQIGSPLP